MFNPYHIFGLYLHFAALKTFLTAYKTQIIWYQLSYSTWLKSLMAIKYSRSVFTCMWSIATCRMCWMNYFMSYWLQSWELSLESNRCSQNNVTRQFTVKQSSVQNYSQGKWSKQIIKSGKKHMETIGKSWDVQIGYKIGDMSEGHKKALIRFRMWWEQNIIITQQNSKVRSKCAFLHLRFVQPASSAVCSQSGRCHVIRTGTRAVPHQVAVAPLIILSPIVTRCNSPSHDWWCRCLITPKQNQPKITFRSCGQLHKLHEVHRRG